MIKNRERLSSSPFVSAVGLKVGSS